MGHSDVHIPVRQTASQIADDLHTLLANAGVQPPYVLVGHSIGGIHARRFAANYTSDVAGLVFVDSADEEQVWRYERISHSLLFEYRSWPNYGRLGEEGFLPPGTLLKWRQDVSSDRARTRNHVASEHVSRNDGQRVRGDKENMGYDAARSCYPLQVQSLPDSEKSGHYIHIDQPELVVDAIREVQKMPCLR